MYKINGYIYIFVCKKYTTHPSGMHKLEYQEVSEHSLPIWAILKFKDHVNTPVPNYIIEEILKERGAISSDTNEAFVGIFRARHPQESNIHLYE